MGVDWTSVLQNVRRGHADKFLAAMYRPLFRFRGPPDGVKVPDEDWDYLIVLDACRYDAFSEHNTIDGTLEKRVSRGSTSIEYFNRNFPEYYDDIVYVNANGNAAPVEQNFGERFNGHDHFHEMVELYLEDGPYDDRKMTPRYVFERAEEAIEDYPHKRVAVHVMSPHSPYIGPSAPDEPLNIRDYRERGYSWEEIWDLYVEELQQTLERLETFIDGLEGRIAVTADHGEAFGEHGLAVHPHGVYVKELVEVPWLVVEQGERPEIRGEDLAGIDV